jgi:hypothetical protein
MKMIRRRRHFRPRPTRSQLNQQISRVRSALNLMRLEWLLEARQPQPRLVHLRFLNDLITEINDEIANLEQM